MSDQTVIVFGAGATKACGGPLTDEILFEALRPDIRQQIERESFMSLLDAFLVENFHVNPRADQREKLEYPALPLLLSLIDIAIDRGQPFGRDWSVDRLRAVRNGLRYAIFALLEFKLRTLPRNFYLELFGRLFPEGSEPAAISLNYDIIADNALMMMRDRFPRYGCSIDTPFYRQAQDRYGTLLKIHGSLNWAYCPGCHRLDLGIAESGRYTIKLLSALYQENPLEARYSCHGSPCATCSTFVEPLLITPTFKKDYRNPHVAQLWYEAERLLRAANKVLFIGYSMPDDDVEVSYLLKRGLAGKDPSCITVVEYTTDPAQFALRGHPAGRRYRAMFGDGINWHPHGLERFLADLPA